MATKSQAVQISELSNMVVALSQQVSALAYTVQQLTKPAAQAPQAVQAPQPEEVVCWSPAQRSFWMQKAVLRLNVTSPRATYPITEVENMAREMYNMNAQRRASKV